MASRDWLDACPADFRQKLQELIDSPPGFQSASDLYSESFGDDWQDTDEVVRQSSYVLNAGKEEGNAKEGDAAFIAKMQFRRQYAEKWGEYAEALTARHLLEQGLPLREWNWSPKANGKGGHGKGEIDLITQRGNRIIFVEVKARCGRHTDPWQAIDGRKIRRLCRGADIYLKLQREDYEYQFDVALITGDYYDYTFEYIEDAFLAPLRTAY